MLCVLFIFIISPSTSLPRVARFVYFDGALGSHRTRNEMSISCRVFQLKFNAKNQQHQVFNQLFWNAFSCGNEKSMFSLVFCSNKKKTVPSYQLIEIWIWKGTLKLADLTSDKRRERKNSLLFFSNIFIVLFSHRCSLFGLDACRVFLLLRLMFVKHLTQATVACFSLLFSFHLSIVIVLRSLPWHFDDQQQLYCYHFLGPRWSENGNSGENGCLYIGMFYHFHRLFYFTFFFACCCLFA